MEVEEFRKFVKDRKLNKHDVAFFLGYSHQSVYQILKRNYKMSEKFKKRASVWMNDVLSKEKCKSEATNFLANEIKENTRKCMVLDVKKKIGLLLSEIQSLVNAL